MHQGRNRRGWAPHGAQKPRVTHTIITCRQLSSRPLLHIVKRAYPLASSGFCTALRYNILRTACSRLLEKLTGSQLVKNSPHFMEPEGSIQHPQDPATCPCPGPDQSSRCPSSHSLKIHLNYHFLFSHLRKGSEGKRPFRRTKHRWEDNIKMDLQEFGCGGMDWIGNELSGCMKCGELLD